LDVKIHHLPVLLEEVIESLNLKQNGIYVDATVGLGGHAEYIKNKIGTGGRLFGIDRDDEALGFAEKRLSDKRVILRRGSFSDMESLLYADGISEADGILFDLGLSMLQIRNPERGFSFLSDERLDMRMDRRQKFSAWEVVNKYPEKDLVRIFKVYGEERLSGKIAKAILRQRGKRAIDTCSELSEIVEDVYGGRGRIHPATKIFQALRIEVNRELEQVRAGLDAAAGILKKGGRLCVISYHSLEDRIVKHFMADGSKEGKLKIITKKPITASSEELKINPSSRSAKLRVAERT
jgi:16S rRNA (cytosine1402-N4)-methyltransferase